MGTLALLCWAAAALAQGASPTATLVAVGDIRLDGPVGEVIRAEGPQAPTRRLRERLQGDILFGNLECPVTSRGRKLPKTWNFRAPARNLEALKAAGFTVLNLANNHVWDYGQTGFLDTLKAMKAAGLPVIGAGKNAKEALSAKVVTANSGLKVGFVAFTSTFPREAWAGRGRPGVAFADFNAVGKAVAAAKARCDVLVVSFHGGTELADEPNEIQRAFGRAAVDAGADLVLGHHPHVIQAVEMYKGRPILHSLGNFLFVSPHARWSVVARIALSPAGADSIEFLPIDTWSGKPGPAPAEGVEAVKRALNGYEALEQYPERLKLIMGADR